MLIQALQLCSRVEKKCTSKFSVLTFVNKNIFFWHHIRDHEKVACEKKWTWDSRKNCQIVKFDWPNFSRDQEENVSCKIRKLLKKVIWFKMKKKYFFVGKYCIVTLLIGKFGSKSINWHFGLNLYCYLN
mgnify:CR=1 FL=1